jgi:hypothetical protein
VRLIPSLGMPALDQRSRSNNPVDFIHSDPPERSRRDAAIVISW